MDWTAWLRDAAIAATVAAAAFLALRTAVAAAWLREAADRIAAWSPLRALVVAAALTAAVRIALLPAFEPVGTTDIAEYVEKAETIVRDGHPRAQETRADGSRFHRTLGWSLSLAGWYAATGTRGVRSAQVFGVVVACATSALILALGRACGRDVEGRVAALLHAVQIPHVMFALLPYSETWTTFLVAAAAWAFARIRGGGASARGDAALAAVLGVAAGWIVITRTELLWLPFVAAGFLAAGRGVRGLVPAALVLAGAAVPFAVNHSMRDGYPGHLRTSVQGGLILYFGNNPIEVNGHGNATEPVVARVKELYAKDRTGAAARDEALAWMRDHPVQVVLNAPKKAFHLWIAQPQGLGWLVQEGQPGGMAPALARPLAWAGHVQSLLLLALGIAGWRLLVPDRRLWATILVAHLALWCLLAASPRNRYPLEPFLMFAAAAWLVERARSGTAAVSRPTARPR